MKQIKKKTRPVITQIDVPCPKWLQKTILKNLKKASTNRLWPDRAKKAIEILKTISAQDNTLQAAVDIQPSTAASLIQNKCSPEHVSTYSSRVKTLIQRIAYKISNYLENVVRKLVGLRIVDEDASSGAGDRRIDAT